MQLGGGAFIMDVRVGAGRCGCVMITLQVVVVGLENHGGLVVWLGE